MNFLNKIFQQIHYFIFLTAFLIFGIWSTKFHNLIHFFFISFLLTTFYVIKIYFQFNKNTKKILLYIFLATFCFCLGAYRITKINFDNTNLLDKVENKLINCTTLVEDVTTNQDEKQKTIKIKILKGYVEGKYLPELNQKVILIYANKFCNLRIGQIVQFKDLKITASKNSDFKLYLCKENILDNIFIYNNNFKVVGYKHSFENYLANLKNIIFRNLKRKINPETFSYFSSIFLGYKIKDKNFEILKQKFNYWGISHYLARSGLHVLIILILLNFIFRFLPLSILIRQILSVTLIFIYSILTWPSISFYRSIIMFFLCQLCLFLYLPIQTLHIVTLTTFFVLVYNPLQLFFLDFQLSFALTFFLALFFDINKKKSLPAAKNII